MCDSLDISTLEKAIKSLKEALDELKKDDRSFIKDSVVQRFEYTYELCFESLKKLLKRRDSTDQNVDAVPFPLLIKKANELGLFRSDYNDLKEYRKFRNLILCTEHYFDELDSIISVISKFYEEAVYFLAKIKNFDRSEGINDVA